MKIAKSCVRMVITILLDVLAEIYIKSKYGDG